MYFNRSADGGENWLPSDIRITDDIGFNYVQKQPHMAVAPDGTICVLWDDQRFAADPIQDIDEPMYAISTDGGLNWGTNKSAKLGGVPNQKQFQPALTTDANSNFHMAWIDEDIGAAGDKTTVYAKIPAGAPTVNINKVVGDQVGLNWFGMQNYKLDLAVDDNTGRIYIVWADPRNDFTGENTLGVLIIRSTLTIPTPSNTTPR